MHKAGVDLTISQVLAYAVQQYGDQTAVVDKDQTFSFNDLDQLSKRLAAHMFQLGIRKKDVVAVQLPNSWPYVVAHLAIARLGAVFLPLNLTYRQKELKFMFNHSETKAVIAIDDWKGFHHAGMMADLKASAPSLEHIITVGPKRANGDLSFHDLINQDPVKVDWVEEPTQLDDVVTVMFTSGTESDPKAVLHTYRTFIPVHLLSAKEYGFSQKEVILSLTPASHMFAFPVITSGIYNGAKQVMLDAYTPEKVLQLLEEHGVTFLIAAPAQMLDILSLVRNQGKVTTKLRMVLTGGSKIPAKMVEEFRERFDCVVGAQWGMTELGAGTFTRPDDPPHYAVETVGRANPVGEIAIIGEDGRKLPPGEEGQIAYRGDSLFVEYYKNPKATQESRTEDGYFLTGDLGWLDEQGYVHFAGRKKDIINRGGLKVHAAEVEEALMMHPNIRQAAVVSVPDERLGEKGMAIVSLRSDAPFTMEEMVKFLSDMGMAKYKLPEYLEVRDELPTTPSGKVRKGELRKEIEARTSSSN
jgi:acyl-CoA synthetase (AMP-forming)/AMP-acid ligase II